VRKLFSLTVIILLIGGAADSSALRIAEPEDKVVAEVTLPDHPVQRFKVPVVYQGKGRKIIDDQVAGGEWAWTETCTGHICSWGIWIIADALDKNEVSVGITLRIKFEGGKKCEVTREFRIVRGKSIVRKMKCRNAKAHLQLSY
jgi:hypothetical protein